MAKPIKQVKVKKAESNNKNVRNRQVSGLNPLSNDAKNWWLLPTDKIGGAIQQLCQRVDDNNYDFRERFMRYARLYGNYESLGWMALSGANRSEQTNNRPVYNIIQSCVDTVMSKIVKDNPKPYFITSGADYFDKLKAEKMTQFVQGIFQETNLYQIANNKVFRDAAVYGIGAVEFSLNERSNRIEAEWVFVDELKIDQMDAMKSEPRTIQRCQVIQKELLIERFPDKEKMIEDLCTTHPHYFKTQDTVVDLVVITKSWHLQNGKKKGRHVITLVDQVLLDEDYEEDTFPFAFFPFYEKVAGMYGRGITEAILSGQVEINKILMFIQQCQELQASPVILAENESQIANDTILSNNIARWIKYRAGTEPPRFMAPQACDPYIYQHLKDWMAWCYQEVGISQLTAGGEKQPGVNSAIAMRTMVDVESSRFVQVSKNWENWYVNCAEICIKIGKRAFAKDAKFSVRYTDKKSKIIKEIPWSKINLPDDIYTIRCDTISGFPDTAAGRIQTITDFFSQGLFSRERTLELLNMDPDLEEEIKLQTSSLRLCEKRLCQMVEDGEYNHPEKYINVKLAISVSTATMNQLQIDDCPEDRLALVRQWITELTTLSLGQDPQVQLLQSMFTPPAPATQLAPQAGVNPQ